MSLIPILIGITFIVFSIVHLIPGDVIDIILSQEAHVTAERRNELERMMGLDKPIPIQYLDWLGGIIKGDFGTSVLTGRPILPDLLRRFPVTFQLTVFSLFITLIIAIPLGIISAYNKNSFLDGSARILGILGLSIPDFWLATLLVLIASLYFPSFYQSSWVSFQENPIENIKILILPSISLGLVNAAMIMRMLRATLMEVLQEDYIITARGKGLTEKVVVARHAFKNALIPVITLIGIRAGYLMGGAIIIETIYSLPGIGSFILNGISNRDYPLVQAGILYVATFFVLINLLVDIIYAYLNPKVRFQ
jgi:peptide/nickel transport system permease protein